MQPKIRLCAGLSAIFLAATMISHVPSVSATDWRRSGSQRQAVEGTRSGGGSTNSGGGFFGTSNPGPSAADIADQQARAANEQGVEAYKKGDWATAAAYFKQSLQNYPDDPTYRQNLVNAETNMVNQQAREKAEREEKDRQRQNKVAVDNMQQSIQNFAQTLNAAPLSGGLDFDGRAAGAVSGGGGNAGGLDFTASVALPGPARPAPALPSGDPRVVDARNVPSGLPKGVDGAIAGAYRNAPPGVSDRVRKGFQAVMDRDWKVAKAWFEEARNRDPGNPGLKRLVALADNTPKVGRQATAQAVPKKGNQQLPDPDDIRFLFPGLQAMQEKEAMEFLFGLSPSR